MCDSEKQRMDDKKEAFDNTTEDVKTAERAHRSAAYLVAVACGAALFAPVPAGGAYVLALANMDIKADDFWGALAKKDRASNGYNQAKAAYDKCMTKQKPQQAPTWL